MYIGIDLGGTNIGIGIVDGNNNLIYKTSMPTKQNVGFKEIADDMIFLINKVLFDAKLSMDQLKGIGIGVPGIVDPKTFKIIECVNLKWRDVSIKEYIEEIIDVPVFIGNDATVAGVAEYAIGAMKGFNMGVLLTLGTGIGAGIIINKKIYDGAHGIGSEIGHLIVGENYYDCNCGRNGCLETFCSSTAIIRYSQKLIKDGKESIISELVENDLSKINGKIIFQAAKFNDDVANMVIDRMVKYLAIGIVNTISVLDPEVIVIGGGLSAAGDFLLLKLKKEVVKRMYFKGAKISEIVLSKIGNDGGIIGAANLCIYY